DVVVEAELRRATLERGEVGGLLRSRAPDHDVEDVRMALAKGRQCLHDHVLTFPRIERGHGQQDGALLGQPARPPRLPSLRGSEACQIDALRDDADPYALVADLDVDLAEIVCYGEH